MKIFMKNNDSELKYFAKTGFFQEKDLAMKHFRDTDNILTSEGVDYCLMFGTVFIKIEQGYIRIDN